MCVKLNIIPSNRIFPGGSSDRWISSRRSRSQSTLRNIPVFTNCSGFLFSPFTQTFDIHVRIDGPNGHCLVSTACRFSAFPKGPHQLVSRIPITGLGSWCRSHHINPHLLALSLFVPPRWDDAVFGGNGAWIDLLVEIFPASASTSDVVWSIVDTIRLRRKRIGKYDFSASFTEPSVKVAKKPSEEDLRQGPKHYKPWYAGSALREHPYWSENLKYVC